MADGTQQRVQTVLRKSLTEGISTKDLLSQITTKSDELTEIVENLNIVEQTLGNNFITNTIQQITSTKPNLFKDITESITSGMQTKEFDCENEYFKNISNQIQITMGNTSLESVFGTNESYSAIESIYEQMHSRISQYQSTLVMPENNRITNTLSNDSSILEEISMTESFSNLEPITPLPHPLDRYRELLEKYDIQFIADDNFPQGRFVALDRLTSQSPQYSSKEEMDTKSG